MSLFIIGNGFDLHHNDPKLISERRLKTRCSDYLQFLLDECLLSLADAAAFYFTIEDHPNGNWSQFESVVSNWLRNPLKLQDDRHFEPEKIIPIIYDSNNIRKWVQSINQQLSAIEPSQYFSELFTDDDYFICFNYTDTLTEVYGIREDRILFVHGRASKNDSNLIMGHCTDVCGELEKERYGFVMTQKDSNETNYPSQGTSGAILKQHPKLLDMIRNFYKNPEVIVKFNADFFQAISSEDNIHIIGHNFNTGLGLVVQCEGDNEEPRFARGQEFDPTDYFYYRHLGKSLPKLSGIVLYDFILSDVEKNEKKIALEDLWPQAKLSFPQFPSYVKVEKDVFVW